jgi:D-alanyl-D-alanine carboxypeptidase/D-alanyl-D-alanine-endopeptidase (penicillin-binding protein 4)
MKRLLAVLSTLILLVSMAAAQKPQPQTLAQRIDQIISRPEFRHALFGIEFFSLDTGKPIYSLNADALFTPASTTKLLTEGTALALLGADYRFHTRIYRTGEIAADGTLGGDLVLVASGDPNLSGRIQPDGTLAFTNEDHSYAGSPDTRAVPGDPLLVIRELAKQVAAKGIKRIAGRVLIDASMFPESGRELGTGAVISPIVVNDNIVDVTITPAAAEGAPATMQVSPQTAYVRFENRVRTGAAGSRIAVRFANDAANADGTHNVTIGGSLPPGKPVLFAYTVPQPSRFAQVALIEALAEQGVHAQLPLANENADFKALASFYAPQYMLAEHVSPPLAEDIKVTLKVSQNLHASMMPFILSAVLGPKPAPSAAPEPGAGRGGAAQPGFNLEHDFLQKAGLDVSGASQADGAGGAQSAFYTPDFMVHYLAYMSTRPDFGIFQSSLPVLGRDGTLWNIQVSSRAAGHVMAKTGTFAAYDALNRRTIVTGKGLAGYVTTVDGRHFAFAIYANRVGVPAEDPDAVTKIVGQALGEIAAAAYDAKK